MELNIIEIKRDIVNNIAALEKINDDKKLAIKSLGSLHGDEVERAEIERERNEHRARLNENSLKVVGLRKALVRIDNDTFTDCSACYNEIEPKRLLSNPSVTMCVECASVAEKKGKQYAHALHY